jgi:hypothetical protein
MPETTYSGGCACGQLRYEAVGTPLYAGYCYCSDCRRMSGSGSIPFIGFKSVCVSITGDSREVRTASFNGGDAVRNTCSFCGSFVFGGARGSSDWHTIYAGSLDDSSLFEPQMAIFMKDRVPWAHVPDGLRCFETLPDRAGEG